MMAASCLGDTMDNNKNADYYKKYYAEHKQEINARKRKHYADNTKGIQTWHAEYRKKHKKETAIYNARYAQKNKVKIRVYHRKYRAEHEETERTKNRERWLAQYNLSIKEYNELLTIQSGVCAICGNPPNGKYLNVDHDHSTGKVRGLLCQSCNVILGCANDSIETLLQAIEYLKVANNINPGR